MTTPGATGFAYCDNTIGYYKSYAAPLTTTDWLDADNAYCIEAGYMKGQQTNGANADECWDVADPTTPPYHSAASLIARVPGCKVSYTLKGHGFAYCDNTIGYMKPVDSGGAFDAAFNGQCMPRAYYGGQ